MLFTIKNAQANKIFMSYELKRLARIIILNYPITTGNRALNNLIISKYGMTLQNAGLWLLANCKFLQNRNNEILVIFTTRQVDNLATLITYGNGKVQGCDMLTLAFGGR